MNKATAKRAAKWWADHLRNGARLDNGDESANGGMAMVLGLMAQRAEAGNRPSEKIDAFESALAKRFMEMTDRHFGPVASVDYGPCGVLHAAATEAQCDLGMASLPWKTDMRVTGELIEVKCGYGASYQTLN